MPTNLAPAGAQDPAVAFNFTWSRASQLYYAIRYRVKPATAWAYSSGKTYSTTGSHAIAANTFPRNSVVEWQVRTWYGAKGTETQEAWSDIVTVNMQAAALDGVSIKSSDELISLRVVALGKSTYSKSVRFGINSMTTGEFDLSLSANAPYADSGLRIFTGSANLAFVREMPDYYGDYSAYSESSTYLQYGNYGNDYGNDYGSDYGNDYGNDYGSDYGSDYGDYGDYGDGYGSDNIA